MPALTGRSTGNVAINASMSGVSDKLTDFEKALFRQDPNDSPIWSALISEAKFSPAGSTEFTWMEMADTDQIGITNDATLAGVTTATWMGIDSGEENNWLEGMIALNNRTGEYVYVDEVEYDASPRVHLAERGLTGGAAAAVINDNDTWTLLQVARPELSNAIPMTSINPTAYYNYCQFMSDTMEISWQEQGRKSNTYMLSESTEKRNLADKMRWFKKRTSATFYLGNRSTWNVGSTDVNHTTGGAAFWLAGAPGNADLGGGVLNLPDVMDILGYYQELNNITEAHMFMRPSIATEFQKLFVNQVQYMDKLPNQLNYHWTKLNLGGTIYNIHADPLLTRIDNSDIWIFDLKGNGSGPPPIEVKHQQVGGGTEKTNGRPAWIHNQQDPDYSAKKDQIVAGLGFKFAGHSVGRHARISNVAHM